MMTRVFDNTTLDASALVEAIITDAGTPALIHKSEDDSVFGL